MDYKEFSSKIKAKYPQYNDMADDELARRMVEKYPEYKDVTFDATSDNPEQASFGQYAQKGVADALKAVTKTFNPVDVTRDAVNASANPEFQQKVAPWLPAVGGAVGALGGPAGIPIGAGLGSIGQQVLRVANNDPTAPTTPMAAAKDAMIQTAVAGVPEVSGWVNPGVRTVGKAATDYVVDKMGNAAVGFGRRALGYTKQLLKDKVGQVPGAALQKANDASRTMLDEGVIQPFSGASGMVDRAKDLADQSEANVAGVIQGLNSTGAKSINTNEVVRDVYAQLSPRYSGGAYENDKKILDEVVGTIRAHGNGPISFDSAQALKNKLQDLGKFQQGGDSARTEMYQRASGIVRQALDNAVAGTGVSELGGEVAPQTVDLAAQYGRSKQNLGRSWDALRALGNRVSSEEGNRLISGTDFVAGAGAAATGEIPIKALPEKLGLILAAKRGIERYGQSTAAWTLDKAANMIKATEGASRSVARRALISKIITSEGQYERNNNVNRNNP